MNAPVLTTPPTRKPHRLAACCREAISADRALQTYVRAGSNTPPWDSELERNALGLALVGDSAVPAWLEPRHFYALDHARIFEAARATGALHLAAARLRDVARSSELSALVDEAVHAVAMGWEFRWERLRELARQRELLETMARVAILLRASEIDHAAAVGLLRDCVRAK